MALVNSAFTVNVTPGAMPPVVHVSEYDVGRTYTVTINGENGSAFNIPNGTTATVEGTLNGSVGFTQSATISNNQVSFALSESMTAYAGKAWCKIKLTLNNQPIQTCAFVLAVDRAGVEAETVIGADGFDTQIQNAVDNYLDEHPVGVEVDPTLSVSGAAADAKAVGDALDGLGSRVEDLETAQIETDATLSQEGAAADAKAVGDAIKELDNAAFLVKSPYIGKKVNVLGDSITAGNNIVTRYWQWLQNLLGCVCTSYGVSGTAIAKNSNQPTQAFYLRYADMTDDADVVIVMGGTNDKWHGSALGQMGDTTGDTFFGAMDVLCAGLRTKYPVATIVFITPAEMTGFTFSATATVQEFADAIKEVCAKYAISVFDHRVESGIWPYNASNLTLYTRDGVHLNELGHEQLGKRLANHLLALAGFPAYQLIDPLPDEIDGTTIYPSGGTKGYITGNGSWSTDTNVLYTTDYYRVPAGAAFTMNLPAGAPIAYYTANKTFISRCGTRSGTTDAANSLSTDTTPANCAYIRIMYNPSVSGSYVTFTDGEDSGGDSTTITPSGGTAGYINRNGELVSTGDTYGFYTTDFKAIPASTAIKINLPGTAPLAYYTSGKVFISRCHERSGAGNSSNTLSTDTTPPNCAYVRICYQPNVSGSYVSY